MSRTPEEILKRQTVANRQTVAKRQTDCPHIRNNGDPAFGLQHNFPDRQVRGICLLCGIVIHPRHWEIAPPTDAATPWRAVLVEQHPFYPVVLMADSADAANAILTDVRDAAVDSAISDGGGLSRHVLVTEMEEVFTLAFRRIYFELRNEIANWLDARDKQ